MNCCTCRTKISSEADYCASCNEQMCEFCWDKHGSCHQAKISKFKEQILATKNNKMIKFFEWIWL